MLDYLVSTVPAKNVSSDPVVVVIPIGWMKRIINKYPDSFDIFMKNMFSEDSFSEYEFDRKAYTESLNGSRATTDDIIGWIKATKQMIEAEGEGPKAWEYMRKNIHPDVMMGFDMQIGGSEIGPAFRKLLKDKAFKNVDRLIIPIHQIIDSENNPFPNNDILSMLSSSHIDEDGTLKMVEGGSAGVGIKTGIISNDAIEELFEQTGLMPKGLYRLMNLSDVNLSWMPSSINYRKLKI
jgi:hypothetical protein